jgi:hypothetical protein
MLFCALASFSLVQVSLDARRRSPERRLPVGVATMSADFTVIQPYRQRFGDQSTDLEASLAEQDAEFVGLSKSFVFACKGVAGSEQAVLQFETLGVSTPLDDFQSARPRNILRINGSDIPGGITQGEGRYWKTHSMIVPGDVLREDNVLYIECPIMAREHSIHYDDFIIDNITIMYKTGAPPKKDPTLRQQ